MPPSLGSPFQQKLKTPDGRFPSLPSGCGVNLARVQAIRQNREPAVAGKREAQEPGVRGDDGRSDMEFPEAGGRPGFLALHRFGAVIRVQLLFSLLPCTCCPWRYAAFSLGIL